MFAEGARGAVPPGGRRWAMMMIHFKVASGYYCGRPSYFFFLFFRK